MTEEPRRNVGGSVRRMTPSRQLAVAPIALALLGLSAGEGCGASTQTASDLEDFTTRPDAGPGASAIATGDGGTDASSAVVPPPPETTCTLAGPPALGPADVLVFQDDFDGASLAPAKWTLRDGFRRTGILNYASSSQVELASGLLRVSAQPNPAPADPTYPYDAGFADTLGKFARTYGRLELRARFPYAPGVWYALWGRPWSQPFPEIDIELVNRPGDPKTQLYFVNHWAAPPIPADLRRAYVMLQETDYAEWHVYTVDWTPGALAWKVDGVTKMTASGDHVPSLPVYWMINSWVGGWPGNPTADTTFPVTFEVDWMKVWRTGGLLADPLVRLSATPKTSYGRADWLDVGIANFDEACAHVELRDGDTTVWTTSTAPYRVPLAVLAAGKHTLTVVATDGVRSASTDPFTADVK